MKCPRCKALLSDAGAPCPSCLLAADSQVETFAGLVLEDELGKGGMGSVFRARHLTLGRSVAVKFLSPDMAASADGRARFEREARALALLDHPNIVRIHDFGVEDGESYLVMELVEGGDLSKKLPLPVNEAVSLTKQLSAAVGYAHGLGVVHRDIKPQNVLLTANGQAKLTDFGIARVTRDDGQAWPVTSAEVVMGSVGFTAPEVAEGGPATPTMDIYSLGALLRSMITGRAPVGELSGVPSGIEAVIRKAMAQTPSARYPTAQALGEALEALSTSPGLPEDERMWMRAVAFVQTASIAAVLWAGVLSLTPRILLKNDLMPLTSYGPTAVDAQHVLTRARFETGAILTALGAVALAFAVTASLKRHWRIERLDQPDPAAPLRHSGVILGFGIATIASYGLRLWTVQSPETAPGWMTFLPFFGGVLELTVLYTTVLSVLEATRRSRPLTREPWLWVGQGLALVPPVCEFFRTL